MWNTNVELEQRISALEKKFIQTNEPSTWDYKWEFWFDEVTKILKFWDWEKYVSTWWNSWSSINFYNSYNTKASWIGTVTITAWFQPKIILIEASYNWASWNGSKSHWQWTSSTNQACTYSHMNTSYETNTSTTMIIQLRKDSQVNRVYWAIQSISSTWFVLDFSRCDFAINYIVTCIW